MITALIFSTGIIFGMTIFLIIDYLELTNKVKSKVWIKNQLNYLLDLEEMVKEKKGFK